MIHDDSCRGPHVEVLFTGSISQRYGSPDPYSHQNVTDPQHWYQVFATLKDFVIFRYLIVETNYRVYAYTESSLQLALVGLFTEMLYR